MEKEFFILLENGFVRAANAAIVTSKLRQIAAGGVYHKDKPYSFLHYEKINALKEIIEGTDSNILCIFQFKFERSFISRKIVKAQFIDGSTSIIESNRLIKEWNKKKIKLLCCHAASTSHGLNLQHGGSVLVWLSPEWSLEKTLQMEARIYRQGQPFPVFIHTIICEDTIETLISDRLSSKKIAQSDLIKMLEAYQNGKES